MKGLDTNVLVRYLVQDDLAQGKKAAGVIRAAVREGEKLYINLVVACELNWVLESAYGFSKAEIAGVFRKILSTKQFEFQEKDVLWKALDAYANVSMDFADAVIGFLNFKDGCSTTLSFDKSLKNSQWAELI